MPLAIKITGLEEVYDQEVFDYYEDLADTLKRMYTEAYPNVRDYHYKNIDFTLVVKANLEGRCFNWVGVEGEYNQRNHSRAMFSKNVSVFFKAV